MTAITVDARGLSCPQPVIVTRNEMKKTGKGTIEVLVDTGTARENVSRLARREGWQVQVLENEDGIKLILKK